MNRFLQRLFPSRLHIRKAQTPEQRLRLFGSVADNDPCLRALYDLLDDVIEAQAQVAFNPSETKKNQRTAWMQVGFCRQLMETVESERKHGAALNLGNPTP